jgi:NADH-quinone oxidoreductase subunit E
MKEKENNSETSNTAAPPPAAGGTASSSFILHPSSFLLDSALRAEIESYFPRYPTRRAVVLPALHAVQHKLGWVPQQAVVEIADMLGLAPAEVQDTLSFYGFFHQAAPLGRHRVWVCRSLSCAARGGEDLLAHLCQRLGIQPGGTTADGRVSLEFAECLGACDFAPAILVNDTLHKNLTAEKIDELLQSWKD